MGNNKKTDVRVVFDENTSAKLRKDIKTQHRTITEQVRHIVAQYYAEVEF